MNVELIVGLAGSGKTTYINKNIRKYSRSVLHDDWVNELYEKDIGTKNFISNLFNINPYNINKKIISKHLKTFPELNQILINYFKCLFSVYIKMLLDTNVNNDVIIECPYLSKEIDVLKTLYKDKLKIVYIYEDEDIIKDRLYERNWDENRINSVLSMQKEFYNEYQYLIDEIIN